MAGKKILFLDVDGVLNSTADMKKRPRIRNPIGTVGVDPGKCAMVRRIMAATGADVVLSSTWRKDKTLVDYLLAMVFYDGLESRMIGVTPCLDQKVEGGVWVAKIRGDEIKAWCDDHPEVTTIAILDDDSDMGAVKSDLFRTNMEHGLTDEIANQVIAHLNRTQTGQNVG